MKGVAPASPTHVVAAPKPTKTATRDFLKNIAAYTAAQTAKELSKVAVSAADDALGGGFTPPKLDAKTLLASVNEHVTLSELRAVKVDEGGSLVPEKSSPVAKKTRGRTQQRTSPRNAFGSSTALREKSTHKMGLERSPSPEKKRGAPSPVVAMKPKPSPSASGRGVPLTDEEKAAAKAEVKRKADAARARACERACAELRACAATVDDAASRIPAYGPIATSLKAMAASTRRSFDAGEAVQGTAGRVARAVKAALPMVISVAERATVAERCFGVDVLRGRTDRQILGLAPLDPEDEAAAHAAPAPSTSSGPSKRKKRGDVKRMVQQACAHFISAAEKAGKSLEELFNAIDVNSDGELHHREFISGSRACGIPVTMLSDDELQLIFRRLDRMGGATMLDGRLDLHEWGRAVREAGGGDGVLIAAAAKEDSASSDPTAVLPPGTSPYVYTDHLCASRAVTKRHMERSTLLMLEKRAALDDKLRIELEEAKFVAAHFVLRREGPGAAATIAASAAPVVELRAKFRTAADKVERTRSDQRAAYDAALARADIATVDARSERETLESEAAEIKATIRAAAERLAAVHARAATVRVREEAILHRRAQWAHRWKDIDAAAESVVQRLERAEGVYIARQALIESGAKAISDAVSCAELVGAVVDSQCNAAITEWHADRRRMHTVLLPPLEHLRVHLTHQRAALVATLRTEEKGAAVRAKSPVREGGSATAGGDGIVVEHSVAHHTAELARLDERLAAVQRRCDAALWTASPSYAHEAHLPPTAAEVAAELGARSAQAPPTVVAASAAVNSMAAASPTSPSATSKTPSASTATRSNKQQKRSTGSAAKKGKKKTGGKNAKARAPRRASVHSKAAGRPGIPDEESGCIPFFGDDAARVLWVKTQAMELLTWLDEASSRSSGDAHLLAAGGEAAAHEKAFRREIAAVSKVVDKISKWTGTRGLVKMHHGQHGGGKKKKKKKGNAAAAFATPAKAKGNGKKKSGGRGAGKKAAAAPAAASPTTSGDAAFHASISAKFVQATTDAGFASTEALFAKLETSGDGHFSLREFVAGARACAMSAVTVSDEELIKLFGFIDASETSDAQISVSEFVAFVDTHTGAADFDGEHAAAEAAAAQSEAHEAENRALFAATSLVHAIETDVVDLGTVVKILKAAPPHFRVDEPWDGDKSERVFVARMDGRRCAVAAAAHAHHSWRVASAAAAIVLARGKGKKCAKGAAKAARIAADDATWASTIGAIRTGAVTVAYAAADAADDAAISADRSVRRAAKRSGSLDIAIKGHTASVLAIVTLSDGRVASASAHPESCIRIWEKIQHHSEEEEEEVEGTTHTGPAVEELAEGPAAVPRVNTAAWKKTQTRSEAELEQTAEAEAAAAVAASASEDEDEQGRPASGSGVRAVRAMTPGPGVAKRKKKASAFSLTQTAGPQGGSGGATPPAAAAQDATGWREVEILTAHSNSISTLCALAGGDLASAGWDRSVLVWDIAVARGGFAAGNLFDRKVSTVLCEVVVVYCDISRYRVLLFALTHFQSLLYYTRIATVTRARDAARTHRHSSRDRPA